MIEQTKLCSEFVLYKCVRGAWWVYRYCGGALQNALHLTFFLPPRFEVEHAHVSTSPHKVSENVLTPLNTVQQLAQVDVKRNTHECRVVFMWD